MSQLLVELVEQRSLAKAFLFAVLLSSVAPLLIYELVRWRSRIPAFGGPAGRPIAGNLYQISHKDAPEQYRIWARTYGPVYQIQLGNIPVLVVNTAAAAKAVFIQNSQATASRPEFYTFHKVGRSHQSFLPLLAA